MFPYLRRQGARLDRWGLDPETTSFLRMHLLATRTPSEAVNIDRKEAVAVIQSSGDPENKIYFFSP